MTKRNVFFIVSIACLGIFILFGAYVWQGDTVYSNEVNTSNEAYAEQAKEPQENAIVLEDQPVKIAETLPVPATPYYTSESQEPSTPELQDKTSIPGAKVGDIIKLGDVEMLVTKAPVRHKIIDITVEGNTSDKPPKLIRAENNQIIYEIPADVDIKMDVTEKITFDKSALYYENEDKKAGN